METRRPSSGGRADFTEQQLQAIKTAIAAGRDAMSMRGSDPSVFAAAFLVAGGMQIPSRQLPTDYLRVLGVHVQFELAGGANWDRLRTNWAWVDDDMVDAVRREVNRAFSESMRHGARGIPGVACRLTCWPNVADPSTCLRMAECDNFGLGPGVFPIDEIVILPPSLDGASFEIIFEDELPNSRRRP